jgi:hypothetical protein
MNRYYLRIEGVNFSSFVLDTTELKVIRGGSLMLLNSVQWLEDKAKEPGNGLPALKRITAGASWGLFSFEAENGYRAGEVARKVRQVFNGDNHYKHTTMTVEVLATEKDYPSAREKLETLTHWSQMQSPTVAVPSVGQNVHGVCEMDKVRPATTNKIKLKRDSRDDERPWVSVSCEARWHENADQKSKFYKDRTGLKLEYTEDLHELAEGGEEHGNCDKKMAVIYLDGNKFGKKAADYCKTESRQKEFDRKLRKQYQNGALTAILNGIKDDRDWKNGDKIRLETLLWGGDEIIWVAPAWKGWELLSKFLQITRYPQWEIGKQELTHACGLVFCHYDAPIQPIVKLAKQLGELAKADRDHNRVAYQVLESFDHTGAELVKLREKRWPKAAGLEKLLLHGDAMMDTGEVMREIKAMGLPKRQIYRIAHAAFQDPDKATALSERLESQFPELGHQIKELDNCFGDGLATWLHMFR